MNRSEVLFAREKGGMDMGRPLVWSATEGRGSNLNLDISGLVEKEGGCWRKLYKQERKTESRVEMHSPFVFVSLQRMQPNRMQR